MARLPLAPGASVLDIGCGCGQTLARARRELVGPTGRVVGVDMSAPMLARARERVAARPEIALVRPTRRLSAFPRGGFDAVYSRFGVMFFEDVRAAFANLRAALRPDGRLAFVCWQDIVAEPVGGACPSPPSSRPASCGAATRAPAARTPRSLRRSRDPRSRARRSCSGRGLRVNPESTAREAPLHIGGAMTLAERAASTAAESARAARAIADAPEDARPALEAAVRRTPLAPFVTDRGVWMDSAAWLVTPPRVPRVTRPPSPRYVHSAWT